MNIKKSSTMTKLSLPISPQTLKWIIQSTGWTISELSQKTRIDEKSIKTWTTRESSIGLADLKRISKALDRPLTSFYYSNPPDEKGNLVQYRTIKGSSPKFPKQISNIIMDVQYVQSVTKDLLELQSTSIKPEIPEYGIDNDAEKVADNEREKFGPQIFSENDPRTKYNKLRDKIESFNIVVMQYSIPLDGARGFNLTSYPSVIVVNTVDDYNARIFTLLHEYAHLLLTNDDICQLEYDITAKPAGVGSQVEKWCNTFAGAFLMPKGEFLGAYNSKKNDGPEEQVNQLSKKFHVSKEASIIRILSLLEGDPGTTHWRAYYNKFKSEYNTRIRSKKKNAGGVSPEALCKSKYGKKYVKLVLDSEKRQLITSHKMSRCLDLKLKHFDKLEGIIE